MSAPFLYAALARALSFSRPSHSDVSRSFGAQTDKLTLTEIDFENSLRDGDAAGGGQISFDEKCPGGSFPPSKRRVRLDAQIHRGGGVSLYFLFFFLLERVLRWSFLVALRPLSLWYAVFKGGRRSKGFLLALGCPW